MSCAGPPPREEAQRLAAELHAAQREAATLRAQLLAAEAAVAESTGVAVEKLQFQCSHQNQMGSVLRMKSF